MNKEILDLTGDAFDNADFSEAVLFFDAARSLPRELCFPVWGVTLLSAAEWGEGFEMAKLGLEDEHDHFLHGLSLLKVCGLMGGEISITLYELGTSNPSDFCRTANGEKVKISRQWPFDESTHVYEFFSAIAWPYGYCNLKLAARGPVTLEVSFDECVLLSEFTGNPKRFPVALT